MSKFIDDSGLKQIFTEVQNRFTKKTQVATSSVAGLVKPGLGLKVDDNGTLAVTGEATVNAVAWTAVQDVPKASASDFGIVKAGTNVTAEDGVFSVPLKTVNGTSVAGTGDITIDLSLYKIVSSLPTADIDANKIYLVASASGLEGDNYKEYIYADSKWELIGEYKAEVALVNYYTKDETYTKSEVDSKVSAVSELLPQVNGSSEYIDWNTSGGAVKDALKNADDDVSEVASVYTAYHVARILAANAEASASNELASVVGEDLYMTITGDDELKAYGSVKDYVDKAVNGVKADLSTADVTTKTVDDVIVKDTDYVNVSDGLNVSSSVSDGEENKLEVPTVKAAYKMAEVLSMQATYIAVDKVGEQLIGLDFVAQKLVTTGKYLGQYIDDADADTLSSAKDYADTQDAALLEKLENEILDTEGMFAGTATSVKEYIDQADSEAKDYTDTRLSALLGEDTIKSFEDGTFTDSEGNQLNDFTDYIEKEGQLALKEANKYTDSAVSTLEGKVYTAEEVTALAKEVFGD
jgi:hypothetical protein